ncbi:sensor histidine kinase [Actinocatenispora comari]|uniref:sensor histidine kinase n=1 Tax=Actinocatenispora comari TaxID=2807577 RepID=UPI001A932D1B|nr:nitrate- and nitrite sensing domain-containing protein [Actinocatenispora comari]
MIWLVATPTILVGILVMVFAVPQVYNAFVTQQIAVSVQHVSIPAVTGLSALQQERLLSMQQLAKPGTQHDALLKERRRADTSLAAMQTAADSALKLAPQQIKERMATLTRSLQQLPATRSRIDQRTISERDVFDYYNQLLDAASSLFDSQARVVPDATASQGGISATQMFRTSDWMSRATALASSAEASGTLSRANFLQFSSLVGSYHSELTNLIPNLYPEVRSQATRLVKSTSWKTLSSAESTMLAHGPWSGGPPSDVANALEQWRSSAGEVSTALVALAVTEAADVSGKAHTDANSQLMWALVGFGVAVVIILAALYLSRRLAVAWVTSRLARLRDTANQMVNQQLPSILAALRAGQHVDVEQHLPALKFGDDELGEVAAAMNAANREAVRSAVTVSETNATVQAALQGIARRSLRPLQHALHQLDSWQQEEEDPEQMTRWFALDHDVTQAQRNIENQIILGGGQPGRRWRHPVELLKVLRQAMSETDQYSRIKLESAPEVSLDGSAVADTSHLLAELLDNALTFSPPESVVVVRGFTVGQGVAIEVEDRGLGMSDQDLDRVNHSLQTPAEFDVTSLPDLRKLGLWVIGELASNHGIRVQLKPSPYGGVTAVVLLPSALLANALNARQDSAESGSAEQPAAPDPTPAPNPLPPLPYQAAAVDNSSNWPTQPWPTTPAPRRSGPPSVRLDGSPQPSMGHLPVPPGSLAMPGAAAGPASGTTPDPSHADGPADVLDGRSSTVEQPAHHSSADDNTRPALPERRRGRHMAPQLRVAEQPEPGGGITSQRPTPEATRDIYSAFQRGSRSGRQS